jgi:hypothetical protein
MNAALARLSLGILTDQEGGFTEEGDAKASKH